MQNTKRKAKDQAAISAVTQVVQEHAEEIDAFLREWSRDWLDQHPEVDVGDGDKTLEDTVPAADDYWVWLEDALWVWLEDALEEWLLDGQAFTERQYRLVAGDEDAREEIVMDWICSFGARTKYQDLPTSSETVVRVDFRQ
jgi:hypothetical protein